MATTPYPFVANAILTASQLNSTFNIPVSAKTASYVLTAADAGTRITMSSASATTITVNTSLFAAGDNLEITNIGAGVCTITAGTATVSTSGTLALVANAGGTLYFTSAGVSVFIASGVAASAGGLVFITGATFTTATNFSLPTSTFTTTYRNYKILISITAAVSNATFTMRMRASGSDDTNNVYNNMFAGVTGGGGSSNVTQLSQTSWNVGGIVAATTRGNYGLSADIITPQAATSTSLITNYLFTETTDIDARAGASNFITATQFDSLTFISSVASNITGTYRVYGYTES